MKKLLLIIFVIIFTCLTYGQVKKNSILKKKQKSAVLLQKYEVDLNKDSIVEKISLFGIPYENNSTFFKRIYFTVKNKKMKREIKVNLPKEYESGYEPSLSFHSFIFERKLEILYQSPTGGSGGITNFIVFSLLGNEFVPIFISDEKALHIKGAFLDNYKVRFEVVEYRQVYEIDISEKKESYKEMKIYDGNKLIKPIENWVGGYEQMKPVDIDNDGIIELLGIQSVKGIANYDDVAELHSVWKFADNHWQLVKVEVKNLSQINEK